MIRGTSNCFGVPGHQGGYNLEPHCSQNSWSELVHPSEWQSRGRSCWQSRQTSGAEYHPRWHRHYRAGPRRVVMVEAIVDPAPDLSAGGDQGEVGYAPLQPTTHSHTNDIPSSPAHTTCPPPHIISCCPLEPVHCIMSHRYLGCDLISLNNDGSSFDNAIMSVCNLQCRQNVV